MDVEAQRRPSRRVLIIDPDADSREAAQALLELWGHVGEVAATAAAAWAHLPWRPEVVILELVLPDMSGYDLATAIRRTRHGAVIRIVAYAGIAGTPSDARARAAGIDLYLMKPVAPETLRLAIEGAAPQQPRPRRSSG